MKNSRASADSCAEMCAVWKIDADKVERLRLARPDRSRLEGEAAAFKAIGHPSRLEILHALSEDDCCVCEISRVLDMPFSTVSQHLRQLKSAGWVKSRPKGKLVIYALEQPGLLRMLKAPRSRHGDGAGRQ